MRAVIFDMDGVLADTEPLYFQQNLDFFRERGVKITHAEFERYVGSSTRRMWTELKERYALSEPVEWLMEQEKESFFRRLGALPRLDPIPGIPDLLSGLKERRVRLGLASSSARKNIQRVLEKTGLAPFFEVVVSGEDVTRGKPAPDIFLKAAQELGVSPPNCLVIEDSHNGVTAAKAAGMTCVGLRNPHSGCQNLAAADLLVGPPQEDGWRSGRDREVIFRLLSDLER